MSVNCPSNTLVQQDIQKSTRGYMIDEADAIII